MPGKPRGKDLLYLVRVEGEQLAGWQMRLPVWHPRSVPPRREYTELFADSRYGSNKRALVAARARRDELFEGLPMARPAGNTIDSRSSTALVGVSLRFDDGRPGAAAFAWVAKWQEKGRQRKRSFAVSTYGFAPALSKAIALREAKTGRKYSFEQRHFALSLWSLIERYIQTGQRADFQPARQLGRTVLASGTSKDLAHERDRLAELTELSTQLGWRRLA